MFVGIRLSELAVGEPLLSVSWEHQGLTGKEAVQKRLEEQFNYVSYLGVNYVIDTIRTIKSSGRLMLDAGINGDDWTLEERLEQYRQLSTRLNLRVALELDLAGIITENNVDLYHQFIVQNIIARHAWVKYWIIGVNIDEQYEDKSYKCPPELYHYLLKKTYTDVKKFNKDVLIGGPNVQTSLQEFIQHRTGWLHTAIGNKYKTHSQYASIEQNGILDYIDFFAFPGNNVAVQDLPTYIHSIRTLLFEHLGSNNVTIFQTLQGNKANVNSANELELQAFYDVQELLTAVKYGTIPFKNELVDAFNHVNAWQNRYDASRMDYGLIQYSLITKPNYSTYAFIFNAVNGFNKVVKSTGVYEENENLESITLQKEEDTTITNLTIIWPKSLQEETVVLLPASYLREYQVENGTRTIIHEHTQVDLKNSHFLLVFEKITHFALDEDDIRLNISRRLYYQREILDHMMSELPSSYNKETTDLNIYRLFRTIAMELADGNMQLHMIHEDGYLDSVREEAIYNNFGVLVKLEKQADWSYTKYKKLIKGLLAAFYKGPTCTSVATALQLFTNFRVSIGELYKDSVRKRYPDVASTYNPDFTFVIEIEKPLENKTYTQEELLTDTAYILKLVKPAHTIGLLILMLTGSDDWNTYYRAKYETDWQFMDDPGFNINIAQSLQEGTFGWKAINYDGVIAPAPTSGIYTNDPTIGSSALLGPRYTLFDSSILHDESTLTDVYFNQNVYDQLISYIGHEAVEEYNKYQAQLMEMSLALAEPRFGFNHDKYLQLSGNKNAEKVINKYLLFGSSNLRDEGSINYDQFLRERYAFQSFLDAIQFSTKNGFGKHFNNGTNAEIITQWQTYLHERPFTEKLSNGEVVTRILTDLNVILDGYKDQFKKIEELELRNVALSEQLNISDDPVESFFRFNQGGKKLSSKKKERVHISTLTQELYNVANDYLPTYFNTFIEEKYDKPVIDFSYVHPFISEEELVDCLHDRYIRFNVPIELAPIQYLFDQLVDVNTISANGLNDDEVINILQSLTSQYNLYVDFNSPAIKDWINSVRFTLKSRPGKVSLLRSFIRKNNDQYYFSPSYNEKMKDAIDVLPLIAFYTNEKYEGTNDETDYKQVNFDDEIIVHDLPENPLYFVSNEFVNFSRFNTGRFITNKSTLTEMSVQGSSLYDDFIYPTDGEHKHLYNLSLDEVTNDVIDDEIARIVSVKELYDRQSEDYTYISLLRGFDWDKYGKAINTHITYHPQLNETVDIEIKDENVEKAVVYDEFDHFSEYDAFQLNKSRIGRHRLIRFYQSRVTFGTYEQDQYNEVLERHALQFLYNDHYVEVKESLGENGFNPELFERYFIPDEDRKYQFNRLYGPFISTYSKSYSADVFRRDEYDVGVDELLGWMIDNTERYKRIKEESVISTELDETNIIYDDEREATTFSSKLRKFIKKKAARYNFSPEFRIKYDKEVFDYDVAARIDNSEVEIYNSLAEFLLVSKGFTEQFILYNAPIDTLVFNRSYNHGKFIKTNVELSQFNPIYYDLYASPIFDSSEIKHNSINEDEYDKAKELTYSVSTSFVDRFMIRRNENALRFNGLNNKYFIGPTTALYHFGTFAKDKYEFTLTDRDVINRTSFYDDVFKKVKESQYGFVTKLTEKFTLYDDENALHFNGPNDNRFIGRRTAIYQLGTSLFDEYKFKIVDEHQFVNYISKIYHDEYKAKADALHISKGFTDQFVLYDDENVLHFNGVNSQKFVKYRTALYHFGVAMKDVYDLPIRDKKFINYEANFMDDRYKEIKEVSHIVATSLNERFILYDDENSLHFNGPNNGHFIGRKTSLYTFSVNSFDEYEDVIDLSSSKQISKYKETYQAKNAQLAEVKTYEKEKYSLFDEDNLNYFKFNLSPVQARLIGKYKFNNSIYANVEKFDVYDLPIEDEYAYDVSEKKIDVYEKPVDVYSAIRILADLFHLNREPLQFNHLNNKKFIKTNNELLNVTLWLKELYDQLIIDNLSLAVDDEKEETFDTPVDVYMSNLALTDVFDVNREPFKFNGSINKKLIKTNNELLTLAYFIRDVYDQLISESYNANLFTTKNDFYVRPIDKWSSTWAFTDVFDINREPFRFNGSINKKLIKTNNELVTSDWLVRDKYNYNFLFDKLYNSYRMNVDADEYKPKNDVYTHKLHESYFTDFFDIGKTFLRFNGPNNQKFIHANHELLILSLTIKETYNKLMYDSLCNEYRMNVDTDEYKTGEDSSTMEVLASYEDYMDISNTYLRFNDLNDKKFISKMFDVLTLQTEFCDFYHKVFENSYLSYYHSAFEESIDSYEERYSRAIQSWNYEEFEAINELLHMKIKASYIDEALPTTEDKKTTIHMNKEDRTREIKDENHKILSVMSEEKAKFINYQVFQYNKQFNKLVMISNDYVYQRFLLNKEEHFKRVEEDLHQLIKWYIHEDFNEVKEIFHGSWSVYYDEEYSIKEEELSIRFKRWEADEVRSKEEWFKYYAEVDYNEKFSTPDEEITTIDVVDDERYIDLNHDERMFQFNKIPLNHSKFVINSNEVYQASLLRNDKYEPKFDSEGTRKVKYVDEMKKPKIDGIHIQPSAFSEIVRYGSINPFKFTSSKFNKKQFVRRDISDGLTAELNNSERIKKPLLALNSLNFILGEEKQIYVSSSLNVDLDASYNEVYKRYLASSTLWMKKNDKETYELLSTVAYMQLEKMINNDYVVVKKSSYV